MILKRLIFYVACFAFTWPLYSHGRDIKNYDLRIVTADDTDSTKRIAEEIQKKFPSAVVVSTSDRPLLNDKNSLYFAVGPSALRSLRDQDASGVITSLFTSRLAYREIMMGAQKWRPNAVTAIYADPSPANQMRLISLIYKNSVGVEVIVSEKSEYLLQSLRVAATQENVHLNINNLSDVENINRTLNKINQSQVLLAVPDGVVFNSKNIKNILITTYRKNIAVIGFSSSLVKAGALATTYSETSDILAQLVELVNDYRHNGKVHDPEYPKYFRTLINEDVAHSLNMIIDDKARRFSHVPALSK